MWVFEVITSGLRLVQKPLCIPFSHSPISLDKDNQSLYLVIKHVKVEVEVDVV